MISSLRDGGYLVLIPKGSTAYRMRIEVRPSASLKSSRIYADPELAAIIKDHEEILNSRLASSKTIDAFVHDFSAFIVRLPFSYLTVSEQTSIAT